LRAFRKEILLHSQLKHINFVQLFAISLSPLAMILEFVSNGTLFGLIHDHSKHVNWSYIKVRKLRILYILTRALIFRYIF
jgi:hypothetical protein